MFEPMMAILDRGSANSGLRFDHVLDYLAGGSTNRNGEYVMKDMIDEFKDFIKRGNVVTIAVAFIMALYFQKIVEALLDGIINPIIGAIFGESSINGIGFDIGDARISIGLVIDAAISFVLVAFILFLMVKAYNNWQKSDDDDGEAAPTEVDLLTEIRDSLAKGS